MVTLIDPDVYFIERTAFGPRHIAKQVRFANWRTFCGREWRDDRVDVHEMRSLSDDDPDTYVCRACKAHAPATAYTDPAARRA